MSTTYLQALEFKFSVTTLALKQLWTSVGSSQINATVAIVNIVQIHAWERSLSLRGEEGMPLQKASQSAFAWDQEERSYSLLERQQVGTGGGTSYFPDSLTCLEMRK